MATLTWLNASQHTGRQLSNGKSIGLFPARSTMWAQNAVQGCIYNWDKKAYTQAGCEWVAHGLKACITLPEVQYKAACSYACQLWQTWK